MTPSSDQSSWLHRVVTRDSGYEAEAVARFANQLLLQARSNLPAYLRPRVDPEDVVQSVFHSFFKRHEDSRFQFAESNDVWKLLSAMTYRKVRNAIRHHHRSQRDVGRERNPEAGQAADAPELVENTASAIVVMMELLQGILAKLPPVHQQILLLRLDEHTIEEIAQQVQVSTRTVDRALSRVREISSDLLARGD